MTREEYWYWITNVKGLYRHNIKRLLDVFSDPEEIYKASEETLSKSGAIENSVIRELMQAKNCFRPEQKLEKLKKEGIRFIYFGSGEYPEKFSVLTDYPYSFYVKGQLPDPKLPSVGIVGSRACSGYGKEMTLKFSQALAANNVQIISGMAAGVDTFASRGTMEAGGKTFVVLGSGLDVIYPQENIELYYQIIFCGGGVISEYPLGTPPNPWQFPHRNRLISALSDKLLIMEARKRSGTSSTASCALEQGKDVYALPGRLTDPLSEGCNKLIADGAGVLIRPEYLLDDIFGETGRRWNTQIKKKNNFFPEENDRNIILAALSYEPAAVGKIAEKCGIKPEIAAEILTELELKGYCVEVSKDYYAKG